jgi:hypothetical protein
MWPKGHYTTRHGLIAFNRAISWIELSPRAAQFTFVNGTTQLIGVTWLRIGGAFQSVRPAFQCPTCNHVRLKLYVHQNRLRCYRCTNRAGVPYTCQTITPKARPVLQSKRLRQFLGEYEGNSRVHKPLLMHHRTYNRLLAKLRQIEARPRSRKYSSKKLTQRILRPATMYQTQCAQFRLA